MSDSRIAELVERAFDYRGHVTVSRRDGAQLVGFVYDRGPAHLEMFDEGGERRIRIALEDIADVALTGEDIAAQAQHRWEKRRGRLESRDTSVWGGWEERPTLFVVALPIELRVVESVLRATGAPRTIARAIGVGGGAAHVIAAERPRLVISCGFAGALDPTLATGDLVLASAVHDECGDVLAAPEVRARAREVLAPREGELWCATRVLGTRAEKRALAYPGRLAVDLESWAIARAAQRANIPWLALRVVFDPIDRDLPPFARDPRGGYVAGALRHALGGPHAALEIAQLGLTARLATRALRRALHQLVRAEARA